MSSAFAISPPSLSNFAQLQELPPVSPERTPTAANPQYDVSDIASPEPASSASEDDDADFQSHYALDRQSLSSSASSEDDNPNSRRPSLSPTHSSFLGPHTFAPPFYGRPPTPLPPSPSLASLLGPPFSTTTSRPTTPDSSDNETPNDTEAAVAKSARTATTVPRASPKVPTYEYYGFALYLASTGAFCKQVDPPIELVSQMVVIYLLWSYLPSPFLHQLGIHYYPNRWWSLAIPAFLVMLIVYIYVALASYNTGYLTLPMNSIENLVDEAANIAAVDFNGRKKVGSDKRQLDRKRIDETDDWRRNWRKNWETTWSTGTDAVMDIPIGGVCEILYGDSLSMPNGDN